MQPRTAYPTVEEFEAALTESGLIDFAPSDLSLALAVAVSQWERDTDWLPFLSKGEELPRRFTLEGGRMLFLKAGLLDVPELFTVDGNELVYETHYWLEPANSKPFTKITFGYKRWSRPQGAVIIGKWGFCEELPDDVWTAIINKAALSLSDQIQRRFNEAKTADINASSIVKAKESGPVRMEFLRVDGTKTLDLASSFANWQRSYDNALIGRVMVTP